MNVVADPQQHGTSHCDIQGWTSPAEINSLAESKRMETAAGIKDDESHDTG